MIAEIAVDIMSIPSLNIIIYVEPTGTLYRISPLGSMIKLSSSVAHCFQVALISSRSA